MNQVEDPDENKGSYSCGWIETRIFCARIPALSMMRDALNHITIEDQAAHHLQTAYRDFNLVLFGNVSNIDLQQKVHKVV